MSFLLEWKCSHDLFVEFFYTMYHLVKIIFGMSGSFNFEKGKLGRAYWSCISILVEGLRYLLFYFSIGMLYELIRCYSFALADEVVVFYNLGMSFIRTPVGVGLSYSINKSDYHTRRPKTAANTHLLRLKVF